MLKIENTEVIGWEAAIRGMRNPMNSWDKTDTEFHGGLVRFDDCNKRWKDNGYLMSLGSNDLKLMSTLCNAGTDHRKFMRMITVYLDITAPLYWWKEFDTYKVGTVANSCSTMHKIADKEFTLEDFSYEHLLDVTTVKDNETIYLNGIYHTSRGVLLNMIVCLNTFRKLYLETKDKRYWWQMIQLLPSSYNQRRTVMLNYEVLANIYKSRYNHKLDEWHTFCDWVEKLPYSELITGKEEYTPEYISVIDKFNEIGNVYPVTSEELAKVLNEEEEIND